MPWFSRTRALEDLITADALGQLGWFELLGPELSGIGDPLEALALTDPLRSQLFGGPEAKPLAVEEIRRHSQQGAWEAVGPWKFARDFVADETVNAELTRRAMLGITVSVDVDVLTPVEQERL